MPIALAGVLPIVQTPFRDNDEIDRDVLRREIEWAIETGASGVGTGMVSEVLRLTESERLLLTETLVECSSGRIATFAAAGGESVAQAIRYSVHAERAHCDAVMVTPPLLTALSVDAQVDYFRAIADSVDLPVIVQDASGYVGRPIPLQVHVALINRYGPEKILFKPEASPIGPNLTALHQATEGRARIYDGSGGIHLVDCFARGIVGTMPGMDLLDGIVALWRALSQGKSELADEVYFPICAIVTLQLQAGLDGFLAIEKHLLQRRGIFPSTRQRQPAGWKLDIDTAREVDRLYKRLQQVLRSHQSLNLP